MSSLDRFVTYPPRDGYKVLRISRSVSVQGFVKRYDLVQGDTEYVEDRIADLLIERNYASEVKLEGDSLE